MKVICAWCIRDGRRGFLREKAPLDDLRETHGLCEEHFREINSNGKHAVPRASLLYRLMGRLLSALSIG
jgi:hypothetical protein